MPHDVVVRYYQILARKARLLQFTWSALTLARPRGVPNIAAMSDSSFRPISVGNVFVTTGAGGTLITCNIDKYRLDVYADGSNQSRLGDVTDVLGRG